MVILILEEMNYHLTADKIQQVRDRFSKDDFQEVAGISIQKVDRQDGVKYFFEDGSWLLLRASGTEPLLRVYAEAMAQGRVDTLLRFAQQHFSL